MWFVFILSVTFGATDKSHFHLKLWHPISPTPINPNSASRKLRFLQDFWHDLTVNLDLKPLRKNDTKILKHVRDLCSSFCLYFRPFSFVYPNSEDKVLGEFFWHFCPINVHLWFGAVDSVTNDQRTNQPPKSQLPSINPSLPPRISNPPLLPCYITSIRGLRSWD